ncbi:hypothetical protein [Lacinutrix sp. Bg11-31]|uniref:hypothetical protein n=1 Tax=Lacinutrix sp. Bg11-31 TaxID=2057808 RepID=UPI000C3023F7|nr:hypothetical protein [Lacinutrix sp. Bg11-31]AUC82234.1 hypothetical protein CW733_08875 [Lacinutrix sp. Bg11-31]
MQLKKYLLNKLPAFAVVLFTLVLTSCGSYQYVGQDSDGIYSEDEAQKDVVQADAQENGDNTYYKNYFKEKSLEMDSDGNEEVFVDIDSYEGSYSEDNVEVANVASGYGAWGENSSEVSINIYNTGFNNYWNRPYYGWNSFGWNSPYFGWNSFGYGYGNFGYGGFYNPYGYNYGYGYGGYYGRNGYGRNGLAYNTTRRGGIYGRQSSALGRRVEASRRSNSTSTRTRTSSTPRTRTVTPRVRTNNSTPRVRSTTPRVRNSTPRTRGNSSTPRTSKPRVRSTTPRTTTPRTSSPSRSSTRSSSGSSSRSTSGGRRRG